MLRSISEQKEIKTVSICAGAASYPDRLKAGHRKNARKGKSRPWGNLVPRIPTFAENVYRIFRRKFYL